MMTVIGGLLFALDAFGVLLGVNSAELLGLGHVERIHEAQALERLVLARALVVGVLDVERRDVVGQQHHFVGEEPLAVGVGQSPAWGCARAG